jgi:hypothetical protein
MELFKKQLFMFAKQHYLSSFDMCIFGNYVERCIRASYHMKEQEDVYDAWLPMKCFVDPTADIDLFFRNSSVRNMFLSHLYIAFRVDNVTSYSSMCYTQHVISVKLSPNFNNTDSSTKLNINLVCTFQQSPLLLYCNIQRLQMGPDGTVGLFQHTETEEENMSTPCMDVIEYHHLVKNIIDMKCSLSILSFLRFKDFQDKYNNCPEVLYEQMYTMYWTCRIKYGQKLAEEDWDVDNLLCTLPCKCKKYPKTYSIITYEEQLCIQSVCGKCSMSSILFYDFIE